MKRLLITGNRGLLGGACVNAFKNAGYAVFTPSGEDLRDKSAVYWLFNKLQPLAGVIHCAAKVGGVKSNRDYPVQFIDENLAINSNVIGAAHAFGVQKLVNIGTSCLYPKDSPVPVKETSLMTGPFEPSVAAYATAKLVAYALCNAYRSQHGRNYVTVCPGNLYGDNDNYGKSAHVIPSLIHRAHEAHAEGKPLTAWGDGSAIRDFLHADDAAEAIRVVYEKWDSPDLINIGSGMGTTIKHVAEMISPVAIQWDNSEPTGIQEKTFDITRIRSLGWIPTISLEDGLFRTILDHNVRLINNTLRLK